MDTGSAPIGRGETLYGTAGTVPASYGQSVFHEGRLNVFPDTNPSNVQVRRTQRDVRCIQVRNASGVTLYAGMIVTWASGYRGRRVAGRVCVEAAEIAGVVDDHLGAGGVRHGDVFNLIVEGPCLAYLSSVAADCAAVTAGQLLHAATAATSQATTAGRFKVFKGTFSAAETTDGTAFNVVANRIGRAISAATTDDAGALRLIDLNITI